MCSVRCLLAYFLAFLACCTELCVECSAVFAVSCVKIGADTEYLRRCSGKLLKDALVDFESSALGNSDLMMELRYYVRLPDPNTHVNHVIQEVSHMFTLGLDSLQILLFYGCRILRSVASHGLCHPSLH